MSTKTIIVCDLCEAQFAPGDDGRTHRVSVSAKGTFTITVAPPADGLVKDMCNECRINVSKNAPVITGGV